MRTLLNLLFGCSCSNLSRVFTTGKWPNKRHYKVCLDCGTEYEYDLERMKAA